MRNSQSEKYTMLLVGRNDILAALGRWGVDLSPYAEGPDNLTAAIRAFAANVIEVPQFKNGDHWAYFENDRALHQFIDRMIAATPEVVEWNNRKNGNPAQYQFTSRYDAPTDPDNDFIDLGALSRNMANTIWSERVESQQFNDEFDRQHDCEGGRIVKTNNIVRQADVDYAVLVAALEVLPEEGSDFRISAQLRDRLIGTLQLNVQSPRTEMPEEHRIIRCVPVVHDDGSVAATAEEAAD